MRKYTPLISLLVLLFSLSSCGLMENAFKAGIIFALIIVAIIALIIWLARIVAKAIIRKYDSSLGNDEEVIKKALS